MNIFVSDWGILLLYVYCLVNIIILDLNDNNFVFIIDMYNVLVDENILVGVKILVVSVIDKD